MLSKKETLVSSSIIASDLSKMGEFVKGIKSPGIDLLHVDVMDGHFVPNLTIGPGYIQNLKDNTSLPLDVHLMITEPEKSIENYLRLKPEILTIHYESTRFPARIANLIKEQNILAGLAFNLATPLEAIYDLIPSFDLALVMAVDPGFYGQPFIEKSLDRIERLSSFLKKEQLDKILIEVDGGINKENAPKVIKAGANILVAGNFLFKDNNYNKRALELKNIGK